MKTTFKFTTGIGVLALVLVALLPFVSSTIYNGLFAPITVTNNNDANSIQYDVNLVAYGDVNGCTDTDNGVYGDINGTITWKDPRDVNMTTHVQSDFCDSNTSVVEMACISQVKINGVQYQNYFIAVHENCSEMGKTFCQTTGGIGKCV
ncbi:MAG: hypothetical protein AABX02_03485 [archaeon]